MKFKFLIFLFITLYLDIGVFGQNSQKESLEFLSYSELKKGFYDNIDIDSLAIIYAETHLKKAKKEKDTIKIADSYFYLSNISNYEDAVKYSDSIINLTSHLNHIYYPALGFMIKGYFHYNHGEDKKAINEYLEAETYAVKNNNLKQQIEIKQFIGGIKYNFGDYKEALNIFKEQLQYIQKQPNYLNNYKNDYLIALDDLSKTYLRDKETDSALIYTKAGIDLSRKYDKKVMYQRFLLTSGSALYFQKKYNQALDSLIKLQPKIEDNDRLAMCLYYIAKIYQESDNKKAIITYNQVDSLYQITNNPFIELRDVYKTLFNYYSENETEKEQLESVKKLITVDSILDLNYKYSETEIVKKHEIPKLKREREKLQKTLNENITKRTITYTVLGVIIFIAICIIILFYIKQKIYKKRYMDIISNKIELKKAVKVNDNLKIDNELNIPQDVIDGLLAKLDSFEKNKDFLKNGITLNSISKKLNTNSTYLSKIVNYYKEESFSNYLNNLRIAYSIDKLIRDKSFRNYTIKAIAEEVGFNTAESFSKSFFKEKGIYPSYFIKQLNR
ncbi:helix-turn-helix domain-containing protein [Xanthomarina sp. F2636L]|uniref:helix-turn-helix domain-containing protein n=1 Tax=Xanthomarina sp. F2636L TaxID=2996018 RepID=UPI00225DF8EC|nr:helix-turn-helix domain-containing protein [Xanthomarina sp. F2636L]MCX7549898.1 helix-turn-helix domain-containing protein [Xanthomarina sp. F2636L]